MHYPNIVQDLGSFRPAVFICRLEKRVYLPYIEAKSKNTKQNQIDYQL